LVRASRQPTDPTDARRREATSDGDAASSSEPMTHKAPAPSRQSLQGLDWFIFFLADVQTGFGPFVAVYLTTQ
jgi:isocitrate lyase